MDIFIDDGIFGIYQYRDNEIKVALTNGRLKKKKKHEFTFGRYTWFIHFHEGGIHFSIEKCVHPIAGYCRLTLLDANSEEVVLGERHFKGKFDKYVCGFEQYTNEKSLIDEGVKLPNGDQITIFFQIVIDDDSPSDHQKAAYRLSEALKNLLASEALSDVTFCAGGQEFKAHKAILGARSPVFCRMFTNHMEETKSGRVEITDISADVLKEMLNFIYTDESVLETQMHFASEEKIDQDLADGLLQAAEKYQLNRLKAICEDALADCLSEESIIRILALSCLHRADALKDQCIKFISSHTGAFIEQLVADGSFANYVLASNPAETDSA